MVSQDDFNSNDLEVFCIIKKFTLRQPTVITLLVVEFTLVALFERTP